MNDADDDDQPPRRSWHSYAEERRKTVKKPFPIFFAAGVGLIVFTVGMGITQPQIFTGLIPDRNPNVQQQAQAGSPSIQFDLCSGFNRSNCVVDGDTIHFEGRKIRIADIDTPEKSDPKCDSEYQLAMKATYRLRDLLNQGSFEVASIGSRDQDQYGRDLRVLSRGGQSLGDVLVSEGLARTWTGSREPWC